MATINPAEKINRILPKTTDNVMGLMVIMGIVLVLMKTIMVSSGVYLDSIDGMLNPIGKMPKTHMVLLEKAIIL